MALGNEKARVGLTLPFNWLRKEQETGAVYVGQRNIIACDEPDAKPPQEPPAPLIDHATKIANVVEDRSTLWMLSRTELRRRDEILDKLKNHVPLSEAERQELARLCAKREVDL